MGYASHISTDKRCTTRCYDVLFMCSCFARLPLHIKLQMRTYLGQAPKEQLRGTFSRIWENGLGTERRTKGMGGSIVKNSVWSRESKGCDVRDGQTRICLMCVMIPHTARVNHSSYLRGNRSHDMGCYGAGPRLLASANHFERGRSPATFAAQF